MRILVIGYEANMLAPDSAIAKRHVSYFQGHEVDFIEIVRGASKDIQIAPGMHAYATGGANRVIAHLSAYGRALRLIRRNAYDVVTTQDAFLSGAIGWLVTRGTNAGLHVQDHSAVIARTSRSLKDRLTMWVSRRVFRAADRIRTVSLRGARSLTAVGIPSERIDVVSVPTDIARFSNVTPVPSDHVRLLTVARLSKEKGIDVLLRAFLLVVTKYPGTTLTIVGDGPERARLASLATELQIQKEVTFAGQQTDLATYFAHADVYVQPSRYEGWGLAVIEAAAAGVPIVMTDVGCAGEVIVNEVSGIVVPPEDERALAKGIERAIEDHERAEEYARNAKQSVEALPSMEQSVASVRASVERAVRTSPRVRLLPIFLTALAIRIVLWIVVQWRVGPSGFELPDSIQYLGLAKSLLAGRGFMLDGVPFSYRTIGYPAVLAAGLFLLRSQSAFALVQTLLAACIPLLIYRVGTQLKLGTRASLIAAWVAVFEPHFVYYSVTIMTETMLCTLFLLAISATIEVMHTRRVRDSLRAGVWFGLGMLVKPLLQFFPIALLVVLLPWMRRISWREAFKHAAIVLLTVFIICAPWMARNLREFGSFSLSSQGPAVALEYLGTSIVSMQEQIPFSLASTRVHENFLAHPGESVTHAALGYINAYPTTFLTLLAINTVTFWTSSNYNAFLNYYHLIPAIDHSVLPPTHYIAQGRYSDFIAAFWQIFSQPFYDVGVIGRVVWIAIFLLFVYGLIAAYRKHPDERFAVLFLVALCLYLTATIWVEGLGIEARLRFPLMPIELLFAAYAWTILRVRRRKAVRRLLVITQRVDQNDRNLAVHVRWLKTLAGLNDSVTVIAQSVGTYELPSNVRVLSLGKEKGASKIAQLATLYRHLVSSIRTVDAILVLMAPMYVLLAAPFAFFRRVPMYLWYTHTHVSLALRGAALCVRKVFSASTGSFRLATPKLHALGHAIDTDFFSPDPSVKRIPGRCVCVGRITRVKHIDVLVDALAILRDRGLDVTLDTIGSAIQEADQEIERQLHAQIERLNLGGIVRFRGSQSPADVRDAYRRAAVSLNACQTGSFDKVVLESMSCGCPAITSNQTFAPIVPPECFVDPTPEAFADAIEKQLAHPSDPEVLRAEIVRHHNVQTTMEKLIQEMRG